TARVSAGCIAWGRAGQGGLALVLLHGWPWSSFAWHRVIAALSGRFTLFWYDMPGYGRSDMNPEQATGLNVQSAVFVEMLDHWALERPAVLAQDIGGAIALRAHLLHGIEFSRMARTNGVALRPWGSEFFDHVRRHVDAFT